MIDDDGEIRMALERSEQRLELARLDQRIESQPQRGQRRERGLHFRSRDPCRIGQVLQHRPHALEQRFGRERAERCDGVVAARSTQPTTPRTRPPLALATSSRKLVSATVGAACTSTVEPTFALRSIGLNSRSMKSR
jgi:hypothetical protein